MPNRTCSIGDCDRPSITRGWCVAHYNRWKKSGDPGPAYIAPRPRAHTGCAVGECPEPHFGLTYCKTHYYRFRSNGDPLVTRPPGSPAGEANPKRQGSDIGYSAAHYRVRRLRGKASRHGCSHCGLTADGWALRHDSGARLDDPTNGHPFSPDPDDYTPMCHSCHWHYDRGLLEELADAVGQRPTQH